MLQKRGFILIVLVSLLVVLSAYSADAEQSGCYLYPSGSEDLYCQPGILDTEAQQDCSQHAGCDMGQHFVPGSDCSQFSECQQVTCSIDCQLHAAGICQSMGGVEVAADQYAYWCSPGCCKIADQFCQFNLNKYQCEDKAQKLGVPLQSVIYDNSLGMSTNSCNQQYCGVQVVNASLTGTVKNTTNHTIIGAIVSLEGTGLE
ncbi:MAG: hypothetical protein AABX05_04760, partial [Nanoarchaeota archaeon]